MSRLPQIPPNPDTITQASLDSPQGWMDYPLRADVIVGDPKCRAKVLRTVGTVTPYKAVSFFTAQPSRFHWRFDNDEAFVLLANGWNCALAMPFRCPAGVKGCAKCLYLHENSPW